MSISFQTAQLIQFRDVIGPTVRRIQHVLFELRLQLVSSSMTVLKRSLRCAGRPTPVSRKSRSAMLNDLALHGAKGRAFLFGDGCDRLDRAIRSVRGPSGKRTATGGRRCSRLGAHRSSAPR